MSLLEAETRLRVEEASIGWGHTWEEELDDLYGGQWLSLDEIGVTLAIAASGAQFEALAARARDEFPYNEYLRVIEVENSWSDLHVVYNQVSNDIALMNNGIAQASGSTRFEQGATVAAGPGIDVGIRPSKNAVEVFLPNFGSLEELFRDMPRLRALYDSGLIKFRRGIPATLDCAPGDCRPQVFGGLQTVRNSSARCTTGFSVSTGPSTRGVLSAGHCEGEYRGLGSAGSYTNYGRALNFKLHWDDVDAEVIDQIGGSWTHLPQFAISHTSNLRRAVHNSMRYNDYNSEGMILGTSGRNSIFRGAITHTHYSPGGSGYPAGSNNYVRTQGIDSSNCRAPGDSGAAVWRNNTAAGLHSGGSGCAQVLSRIAAILREFEVGLLAQ